MRLASRKKPAGTSFGCRTMLTAKCRCSNFWRAFQSNAVAKTKTAHHTLSCCALEYIRVPISLLEINQMPNTRSANAVRLEFSAGALVHANLSGVAFTGDWLWVAGDESCGVDRLRRLDPSEQKNCVSANRAIFRWLIYSIWRVMMMKKRIWKGSRLSMAGFGWSVRTGLNARIPNRIAIMRKMRSDSQNCRSMVIVVCSLAFPSKSNPAVRRVSFDKQKMAVAPCASMGMRAPISSRARLKMIRTLHPFCTSRAKTTASILKASRYRGTGYYLACAARYCAVGLV